MNETPMLFPITPSEFWKQIRTTIEEVVTEKLSQQIIATNKLPSAGKSFIKSNRCLRNFPGIQADTL